jgi:tRNA(Ile)-lysidine synthase
MTNYTTALFLSREEIENYASQTHCSGEDSSNASNKYLRNKIRHDLVPLLKELNPLLSPSSKKDTVVFARSAIYG